MAAAGSLFVWPSVVVKEGTAVVGSRKIVKGEWDETFMQLLLR